MKAKIRFFLKFVKKTICFYFITKFYSYLLVITLSILKLIIFLIITFFCFISSKIKNALNSFLEEIDVTILDQLKASSEKHQYDGAMYTTIEIVWNGRTYKTVGFDDDNPPKKLNPFLNYLHGLIK